MLALAGAVVAVAIAPSAYAALFFLFKPTSAAPGERVTVRLGGTPASFTLADRKRPFKRAMRLYLVPNGIAGEVRSRFDPRLHFVGRLVPDKNTRGLLTFTVPPVDTDDYAVAAWCPGCARYSSGRTFFTLPVPGVSRYRDLMHLRVTMPSAADACPVTKGNTATGCSPPRFRPTAYSLPAENPMERCFRNSAGYRMGSEGRSQCAANGSTHPHLRCGSSQCSGDTPRRGRR